MKKIIIFMLLFICGFYFSLYANKNEDNAKKYCQDMMKKNPDYECKVSSWRGCGPGWTLDKEFRGSGKDYFACKRTKFHEKREEGTEEHLRKAEADCVKIRKDGTPCKVERLVNCGMDWKKVRRYSGLGKNYSVCVPGNRFIDAMVAVGDGAKKVVNVFTSLTFLVNSYNVYFSVVGKNTTKYKFDKYFIDKYQKYYSVNLDTIRYANWHKGPTKLFKAAAITDCYTIYFKPDNGMLEYVRQNKSGGKVNSGQEQLLLHEITHCEQCKKIGGRNNFAMKWFGNLPLSAFKIIKDGFEDLNIHAYMPMEKEAIAKGADVYRKANR